MKPKTLLPKIFLSRTFQFLSFILSVLNGFGQEHHGNELYLPLFNPGQTVVRHMAYSLLYDEEHEQSRWVAYELTAGETGGSSERESSFLLDPLVPSVTASDEDYKGSGYDRGHLAPAADMAWSDQAMRESFYFSNISPQLPSFNRGIWKQLEELVRNWAVFYGVIQVVTGPVLNSGLPSIGQNQVSIPSHFYKALLIHTPNGYQAIGFVMPNEGSNRTLISFITTIDEVERITGLDFFHLLADDEEARIEHSVDPGKWEWRSSRGVTHPLPSKRDDSSATQCLGTTKTGARCKNATRSISGRCYLHD